MNRLFFWLILFIIINGCDPYNQDDYRQDYVVESYLIANRRLPGVKVSKTLPIDESYSFDKAALNDATVHIERLDSAGSIVKSYAYHMQSDGVYFPDDPDLVLAEHRYRLNISFPNNDSIQAETLVPGDFHTVGAVPDTAVYQSPNQIIVNITQSSYPGRQSYFIFTVNVSKPSLDQLVPFYKDALEESQDSLSEYYINSSGIINEENYRQNPDGTELLILPWLSVAFYGTNNIVANAIDDNMYDFVRSQDVQTGGSTLPPGQIQNVIYHVNGGIGIFGSMASDTISVYVKKGNGAEK